MSDLPRLPDALWAILKTLSQHGRPALSYRELAVDVELAVPTIGRHVVTIVDHAWATLDRHGREYRVTITDEGVAALTARAKLPTVQAVVAEARRICRDAQQKLAADPYARPYVPSDQVAYKLSQQYGPDRAILMLRQRERDRRERQAEQDEISDRAERRRERRQRVAKRDRDAELAGLTPGQRLDRALVHLSTLQSAPAARIDPSPVTDGGGGKDNGNPVPKLYDDTAGHARRRVERLVQDLEHTLAEQQRRLCDFERREVAA